MNYTHAWNNPASWLERSEIWIAFRRCRVRIQARAPKILSESFIIISKCLQENSMIVLPQPLPPSPREQQPYTGPGPPHYLGFTITSRNTTLGRTPLDKWSARRRDLYLTPQNTTDIHSPSGIRTRNRSKRAAADTRLNLQTPNVNYSWRTAPLNFKVAFYIFIQQI